MFSENFNAPCIHEINIDDSEQKGVIRSTGYPRKYPNSKDCSYKLTSKFGIKLKVNNFDLEHHENCW